jgi:hypothetical protein
MQTGSRLRRWLTDPLVLVELFIVGNVGFLAADIYVAHSTNGFAHWAEWIPFGYSLAAAPLLLLAMLIGGNVKPPLALPGLPLSLRQRLSRGLGLMVGIAAVVVGVAGLVWHLESHFFTEQTLRNLVYTAPFVAPLAYSGLGLLILLNRMVPSGDPEWGRWVVLLALGGWLGNLVLSLADHAQNAFFYWAEWIPVVASAAAIGVLTMAVVDYRNRPYLKLSLGVMALEIVVGVLGWVLHMRAVAASPMNSWWEKVVYSAPAFAPLLFANLAILAMIGIAALIRCASYADAGDSRAVVRMAAASE